MRAKLVLIAAFVGLLGAHAADAAATYKVYSWQQMKQEQARQFFTDPTVPAPGVNRWDCKSSKQHPDPIVLVHGFQNNQFNNWAYLGPTLANEGFCVFSLNHGGIIPPPFIMQGMGDVDGSAEQVAALVYKVLAATGAAKVDLVGHSLGGFMVEYTPKAVPALAEEIDQIVAIAPPTHGVASTRLPSIFSTLGLGTLLSAVPVAPTQLLPGSIQQQRLHAGGVAIPGIEYTVFASQTDPTIMPADAFIDEPGVTNILWQDFCPDDKVGHSGQSYDSGEVTMIQNVLDPTDPKPIVCVQGPTQ